ncbi:MAG TPA: iron ABC transporter permease, partial [Candidatus Methylomirabilis sp.]
MAPGSRVSLSRRFDQTVRDLRQLKGEPLLAAAIAGIFALLCLFILYPLIRVLTVSVFPDGVFSLRLYREFLGSWFIRQALWNSLLIGFLTALGGTAVGFLFAFTLTRTDIPGKRILALAAILPIISPPFV